MERSFAINLKRSPQIRATDSTRLSVQGTEDTEEERIALERTVNAKTIRELRAIKDEYENEGGNQEKGQIFFIFFIFLHFVTELFGLRLSKRDSIMFI